MKMLSNTEKLKLEREEYILGETIAEFMTGKKLLEYFLFLKDIKMIIL